MPGRTAWFVAGSAAGAWLTVRSKRAAEAVTVDGIHDRLTGWFAGARVLREELRAGAAERETQLRHLLAAGPASPQAPPADNVRRLPTRPAPDLDLEGSS